MYVTLVLTKSAEYPMSNEYVHYFYFRRKFGAACIVFMLSFEVIIVILYENMPACFTIV